MTEIDLYLLLSRHMSSGQARLPAFDRTGFFVTQEMAKDQPDLRSIEKLVLQDPALSTHLLRASNSAYYRGLQEVSTVRQAMVRLGLVEVANIVIMLSQRNTFASSEPFIREQMHDLWIHSVACAQASAWLAKETGHPGMVHSAFLRASFMILARRLCSLPLAIFMRRRNFRRELCLRISRRLSMMRMPPLVQDS